MHQARSATGLSLEAASRAAKISQGYLHKLEAGKVENPSPRVLHRLSEVLDVPYGQLMRLADYLMPEDDTRPAGEVRSRQEDDMTAKTKTEAAPTNHELARLLETVLRELAKLRHSQDELAQSLRSLSGRHE